MQTQTRIIFSRMPHLLSTLHRARPASKRLLSGVRSSSRSSPPHPSVRPYNPGVNLSQFRALFDTAPAHSLPRRRRFRWDWHLRNLLTALIPPAVLYVFLKWVAIQFGGEEKIYGRIIVTEEERRRNEELTEREAVRKRLEDLERQVKELGADKQEMGDHPVKRDEGTDGKTSKDFLTMAREVAKTLRRRSIS